MNLQIFTDGSILTPSGPGGWAYIITDGESILREGSLGSKYTTISRMELSGIFGGLARASLLIEQPGSRIELFSDSQYAVRVSTGQYVAHVNKDLVALIRSLLNNFIASETKVKLSWIRGHQGNPWHDYVDELARKRAKELDKPT